ncbi:MAG: DUF211 domain-containing protein [Planctomycetes bacterium]|nr:DUF211 domain-containing protein [Planctomycetota bacterium]
MNIRRLLLDVDKAIARPSILDIAKAVSGCTGVEGFNVRVGDIDIETVSMDVTVEGTNLDYEAIVRAIEGTGAVVHGLYQLAAGERVVEAEERKR